MTRISSILTGLATSMRTMFVTTNKRILPWVFPIASLALFLWWFCSIPSYKPRPLPSNWTPGCLELDQTSWHELSGPASDDSDLEPIDGVKDQTDAWYLLEHYGENSWVHRIDLATGAISQSSVAIPGIFETEVRCDVIRLNPRETEGKLPNIFLLHGASLEITTMQLQSDAMVVGATDKTRLEWLHPLSATDFVGVMSLMEEDYPDHWDIKANYWFRTSLSGEIDELLLLDGTSYWYKTWPDRHPTTILLLPFENEFQLSAIDLRTAEPVPVPPELNWLASRDAPPMTDLPARRGWSPTEQSEDYEVHFTGASTIRYMVHPDVFGRHPRKRIPQLSEGWDSASYVLSGVRRLCWQQLYDEPTLTKAANRAYQLNGICFVDPWNEYSRRWLTGDLLLTEQSQFGLDQQRMAQIYPDQQFDKYRAQQLSLAAPLSCDFTRINDRAHVVTQTLTRFPRHITEAPAIYRIGILRCEASEVEWIGWFPLEKLPSLGDQPRVMPCGEKLLLWHTRWIIKPESVTRTPTNMLQWTTIPLPADLFDRPAE